MSRTGSAATLGVIEPLASRISVCMHYLRRESVTAQTRKIELIIKHSYRLEILCGKADGLTSWTAFSPP